MCEILSIFVFVIITKLHLNMSKNKFEYYYPENVEIKRDLDGKDIPLIASATGYKTRTIRAMLNGYRKMPEAVKDKCLEFVQINAAKRSLLK